MGFKCSIGIVTYLGRFETYFKPLIKKLNFLFPDYDINIFINGHFDEAKQVKYLRDVTAFLSRYRNIRYITNFTHQSLTRGWNWLILMARCDKILILNDDVLFNLEFRYNLESLQNVPNCFTFNGSWSHFVISKNIIKKIGWFDERFVGVGDEDYDYMCRLAMNGLQNIDIKIHGLKNFVADQENPAWAIFSDIVDTKYAQANRDHFRKKWYFSKFEEVPSNGAFRLVREFEEYTVALKEEPGDMPQYYPIEYLYDSNKLCERKYSIRAVIAITTSFLDSCYWRLRLKVSHKLRQLLGQRYETLKNKLRM